MEERAFRGIWIPKEIWLSKELTLQEKVFLVEIDSLDNDNGCFASNKYFAEFFGLSNSRASQVVKSLQEKGYIKIDYIKKGKETINRIIRINRPPYPYLINNTGYLENETGYLESCNTPIKFSKEEYLENCKDNNILNNNTNINNIVSKKPTRHKYGEYKNVLLSDEELEKLKTEFPNDYNQRIDRLSEYMESTGKHYKSHLATIRSWARKDKPKKNSISELPNWFENQDGIKEETKVNDDELEKMMAKLGGE